MNGGLEFIRTALAARRHPEASRAELRAFQDSQLRRLLVHAYERVPYYRKLFNRHRLHPRHIRGAADLELIPITTKQDLRGQRQEQVLAAGLDPERLLSARTSGSSGEPFTIRRTWMEDKLQHLLALRSFRALGIRYRDRIAVVGLPRAANPNDRKVTGRALRALGIHRKLHLGGLQEPATIATRLQEFQPDVVAAMPGMLCRVADYLMATGRRNIRPRLVMVGGEVLTPIMRRRLTEGFDAPVRQTYASHEFPMLAWECPHSGEFHTCDDGVLLEVLYNGRPALPGEQGEVVATNLNAYAMPFIRYRLGDIVTRGSDCCACGQPFQTIRAIQGRMLDYFALPDGRLLHPYQILATFIGGGDTWIRQYQLLQERQDRIVLRVLPAQTPSAEHIGRIESSVLPLLGPGVEFRVQVVTELPLELTGKFRPSRSLVHSEYDGISHPHVNV